MGVARDEELALLFTEARTHFVWSDRQVDDATLKRLYELVRMAPTSANSQPLRVVFVRSSAAKERLRPALAPLNVEKTISAPVTAIIAYDTEFYEQMPKLFPARPEFGQHFKGLPEAARNQMAYQSAALQAGYLILAARGLGLDVGPMGGFEPAKVDEAFFPDGKWKSIVLVNLGYGDPTKLFDRNPRLSFDEACRIA